MALTRARIGQPMIRGRAPRSPTEQNPCVNGFDVGQMAGTPLNTSEGKLPVARYATNYFYSGIGTEYRVRSFIAAPGDDPINAVDSTPYTWIQARSSADTASNLIGSGSTIVFDSPFNASKALCVGDGNLWCTAIGDIAGANYYPYTAYVSPGRVVTASGTMNFSWAATVSGTGTSPHQFAIMITRRDSPTLNINLTASAVVSTGYVLYTSNNNTTGSSSTSLSISLAAGASPAVFWVYLDKGSNAGTNTFTSFSNLSVTVE